MVFLIRLWAMLVRMSEDCRVSKKNCTSLRAIKTGCCWLLPFLRKTDDLVFSLSLLYDLRKIQRGMSDHLCPFFEGHLLKLTAHTQKQQPPDLLMWR